MEAEVDVGIYPGWLSGLIEAGLSNPGLTGYHSGELLCLTPEAGLISRPQADLALICILGTKCQFSYFS